MGGSKIKYMSRLWISKPGRLDAVSERCFARSAKSLSCHIELRVNTQSLENNMAPAAWP